MSRDLGLVLLMIPCPQHVRRDFIRRRIDKATVLFMGAEQQLYLTTQRFDASVNVRSTRSSLSVWAAGKIR